MRGWAVMSRLAALFLMIGVSAVAARADVKIKARQTMQGQTSEQTTYIKGKRQRTEMMNGAMITVQQCDLRRDLQISSATKTYIVNSYVQAEGAQSPAANQARTPGAATRGGVVTTIFTNKDTGERKQMFGYTARRIISTIVTESSPDSCSPMKSRMETDGWYIDAAFAAGCDANRSYQNYNPAQASGCQDRYATKQVGTARLGYPVLTKTTMFGEDGAPTLTMLSEVVEISQATLDAALFDAPAGYREVKNAAEMYGAPAAGSDDVESETEESSEPGLAVNSVGASRGRGAAAAVGAKREGESDPLPFSITRLKMKPKISRASYRPNGGG